MSRGETLAIWDVWVRLFHWSLAIAVGFQLYTGLTGELFFDWHRRAGEFVLLLIVFRLIWGLVGSSNARLSSLFKPPAAGIRHIGHLLRRDVPQELGHNAAGGWAVLAMLVIIGTQAVTGLFIADEDELVEGALYGSAPSEVTDLLYSIHQINAELIQIILILHVAMIVVYALYAKRNLVRPMITGKLTCTSDKQPPAITIQRWWVGLLCLVLCVAGIGYLVGWI